MITNIGLIPCLSGKKGKKVDIKAEWDKFLGLWPDLEGFTDENLHIYNNQVSKMAKK